VTKQRLFLLSDGTIRAVIRLARANQNNSANQHGCKKNVQIIIQTFKSVKNVEKRDSC